MRDEIDVVIFNEDDKLEYKEKLKDVRDLAKQIVAFANTKGGVIKIGITDNKKIVGVKEISSEDITNIARHNCIPSIIPIITKQNHNGNEIILVKISAGNHPPYKTNGGRYLIRIGPTVRDTTLDELIDLIVKGPHKGTILLRASEDDLQSSILAALRSGDNGTQNAIEGIMKLIYLIMDSTSHQATFNSILTLETITKYSVGINDKVTDEIVSWSPLIVSTVLYNNDKKPSQEIMNKIIDILEEVFGILTIQPKKMDLIRECLTSLYRVAVCCTYAEYKKEIERICQIIEKNTSMRNVDKHCKKALSMIYEIHHEPYRPQRMYQFSIPRV